MFTNKIIGLVLIGIGLLIVGLTFAAKTKEDFYIDQLVLEQGGVCVLESGYCLHQDRNWTGYVIGWVLGASSVLFGVYLFFFERSYESFKREQDHFARQLTFAKQKDELSAFLAGFGDEQRTVLKAIHDQDGITQSTLRYRTGMSKASLSLLLNDLEKKGVVSRKVSGKTKEVFLRKKF